MITTAKYKMKKKVAKTKRSNISYFKKTKQKTRKIEH